MWLDDDFTHPLAAVGALYDGTTDEKIKALTDLVIRLAQEVATLRSMMDNPGTSYRDAAVTVRLNDRGGAGPTGGFEHSSLYPLLISEDTFLRTVLGMYDNEVTEFRVAAEARAQLT